jgi:putative ABC transport system permease protein
MFDFDKWQEIFNSLQRHKLRTVLTAFGVFWGIFMLVILLGVGKGLEKGVYAQFSDTATNSFFMWGERTSVPYEGLNPGRYIRLTTADLDAIRANIPEVRYLNASMSLGGEFTISYNNKNGSFEVRGDFPDLFSIETRKMLQGRFLNIPDIDAKRKVAVIGRRVQEVLFGKEQPLGQYINIKGVFFQVVGVFDVKKIGSQGRDPTELIHIPLSTLQQTFNQGDRIGWLGVRVEKNVSAAVVEDRVKSLLKKRHKVAPEDKKGIGSWNMEEEFKKFQGLFRGITLFIWVVGTGTMIAGIVGVSNIMLIIVKERTREIGIRKALGATPFSIINLILQESIFLTAVSGYMGLVAGVGVIEAVSYFMNKFSIRNEFFNSPEIDFKVAITAMVILVLTGALAGFIPARSAARINPIEALRSE